MKTFLIFINLFLSLNIYAQNVTDIKTQNDTVENLTNKTRFFGIDYKITIPQTPISEKYDLKGINILFTSLNVDLNYAWFLNKKKQNSVILTGIEYSNLITKRNIEEKESERIYSNIPEYIYKIPNIHNFKFNIIFYQKFRRNWDFTLNYDMIISSDLQSFIEKNDFNSIALFYFQKELRNFKIGSGSAIYVIDGKIKILPLASVIFANRKFIIEFLAPLNFNANFKINKKLAINFGADLILNGFNVDYTNSNLQNFNTPDYINNTGFNFSFGCAKNFYETLHWKINTGYSYNEMSYKKENNLINTIDFQEGLFFEISFYSTF